MKLKYKLLLLALFSCASILPIAHSAAYAAPQKFVPVVVAPINTRASQLIDVIKGKIAIEGYFDATFLNAVPKEQIKSLAADLIKQYGQPLSIISVVRKSSQNAMVKIEFEKAIATVNINITATAPNKVNGLLFESFTVKDDSQSKIDGDFASLPGKAGYIIKRLNGAGTDDIIASRNTSEQFAIGSTFKLYILAELAAQVDAKERKWSDVVPLSQRSFSSAATSKWPMESPVTLETLALQMISVSDNSAADTLLHTLGRTAVERKLALIGHSAPDKTLPFLSTVEAFAMKAPANKDLRDRFLKASEADQRRIIDTQQARLGLAQVDNSAFGNGPAFIDTLEWFASPSDIANLMNHIRNSRNDRMLQILSINPGISAADAANWNYVGYKGGSEAGVISMSYLLQSKSGTWYAVSGSWNNPAKEVDQSAFAALMTRLIQSVQ